MVAKSSEPPEYPNQAIAVVGVGCRLPGGIANLDDLWLALSQGRDLVTTAPPDRFDHAEFFSAGDIRPGKTYTVSGGFLDDISNFDAEYFGLSPKEASRVDPQHRLLLECAAEAFDDAAIDPTTLTGSDTAVYVGISNRDYGDLQFRHPRTSNAFNLAGGALNNSANRLSYFFDLRGPSMALDTACSSSLTAIHEACEVLRSGRSRLALAGGVNLLIGPMTFVAASQASMLSPTGRCHPFSALADGFVRAEGVGMFVLKPLTAALVEGDRIHGVILGSAVTCDGHTAGLAMPGEQGQAEMLRLAYAAAEVEPEEVAYVEAHGTGTKAGDPVECAALGEVIGRTRTGEPLPIGSVKSNLGHLESAAGVAGMCKALLVLRERRIPATLHSLPPSEGINFTGLGLRPVTEECRLPESDRHVVGVNSFGFGGANAHVVLASPPTLSANPITNGHRSSPKPVLVTARSAQALHTAAQRMADHLLDTTDHGFADAAHTSWRRARHSHRHVVLAHNGSQAASQLRLLSGGDPAPAAASAVGATAGNIGFVFAGNGSPWPGMGAALLAQDDVFAAEIDRIDETMRPLLGWSIRSELTRPDPERWTKTEVAQPLLFAVQVALVAALAARGLRATAVCGHSVGEVAAAYCAGALDLVTACRITYTRSRLQGTTIGAGRMAAVGLGIAEATQELEAPPYAGNLHITATNSPTSVTVAGAEKILTRWGETLTERGIFFRDLDLAYAFHSPAMDSLRDSFISELSDIGPTDPSNAFYSTVTGTALAGARLDAEYWWRNMREPVQFSEATTRMFRDSGCTFLVEIGPHPVLSSYLRQTCADLGPVSVIASMRRDSAEAASLDATIAEVLAGDGRVDMGHYFAAEHEHRVCDLPAYPWQRTEHWHGSADWWSTDGASDVAGLAVGNPLLGKRLAAADALWRQSMDAPGLEWLDQHRVAGAAVMPAAAFVDIALSATREKWGTPAEIKTFTIESPLTLPGEESAGIVLLSTRISDRDGRLTIASRTGDQRTWTAHVACRVRSLTDQDTPQLDLPRLLQRSPDRIPTSRHYEFCERIGLSYGPDFQPLEDIRAGNDETLAQFRAGLSAAGGHQVHPTVLDGAFQVAVVLVARAIEDTVAYLPLSIETVRSWRPVPDSGYIHAWGLSLHGLEATMNLAVADSSGRVCLQVQGLVVRRFDGAVDTVARLTEKFRPDLLPDGPIRPTELARPSTEAAPAVRELVAASRTRYLRLRPHLTRLTAHLAAAAVAELLPGAATFTLADLRALGILDHHLRALEILLAVAVEHGTLSRSPDSGWQSRESPQLSAVFAAALGDVPGDAPVLQAFRTLGSQLPGLLRGTVDATELIVTSPEPLGPVTYECSYVDYQFDHARALVRRAVAGWPADRPLRILEVGAGTGAVTAALLAELPAEQTVYWYTDLSQGFFSTAKNRFKDVDFIHYQTLDLNSDPADQGLTAQSFDLVVAFDVLHATSDIRASLERIAWLLAEGGQVLVLEETSPIMLIPIFGWLTSLWGFQDTDLRTNGPLLSRPQWTQVLTDCGYRDIVHYGDSEEPARSDFTVMVATRAPQATAVHPEGDGARTIADTGETRRWLLARAGKPGAPSNDFGSAIADSLETRLPRAIHRLTGTDEFPSSEQSGAEWSDLVLVVDGDAPVPLSDLAQTAAQYCTRLHEAASALDSSQSERPTLWIVVHTRHQEPVAVPPVAGPAAALWGAARTLANERPEIAVRRVGLVHSDTDATALESLCELLINGSEEDEIVITQGGRFVSRVATLPRATKPGDGAAYVLAGQTFGPNYELAWRECARPRPGAGELLIEVRAAALNYADVMTVMGHVPPFAPRNPAGGPIPLGVECAGIIAEIGPDVSGFDIGDRVMAPADNSLASHTLAFAERAIPLPDGMTFHAAATIPVVFLTVLQSLQHIARLSSGETVLIHGAAGGVGLAALQVADHLGATVIATAGTPAKRDMLHALGIEHVFDSRGNTFDHDVRACTNGAGVDVVLNSLAGESLVRSLELLKPHGRFIEIGKRDILADNPIPLVAFKHNITFASVELHAALESPAVTERLRTLLSDGINAGRYRPLPYHLLPAREVTSGFKLLQHSRHIGKVVISLDEAPTIHPAQRSLKLRGDRTYLITGGLSGIGARSAIALADHGARHIRLVSRRGKHAPEAASVRDELTGRGVEVRIHTADTTDLQAMTTLIEDIEHSGYPLGGLIHAAMVLDDAPLAELSTDRLRAVLAPKLQASAILDELTRSLDLEFFLVYSSVAALVGNSLQAPYVGANIAMEALVRSRRAAGLPGQAIQLGPVVDAGFVERTKLADQLARIGLGGLQVAQVIQATIEVLADPHIGVVCVSNTPWPELSLNRPSLRAPRTAHLIDEVRSRSRTDVIDDLSSLSPEQARSHVDGILLDLLAKVMNSTPEQIDTTRKLDQLGVESLMASEFAALIRSRLGCVIPVLELTSAPSIDAIAGRITALLRTEDLSEPEPAIR